MSAAFGRGSIRSQFERISSQLEASVTVCLLGGGAVAIPHLFYEVLRAETDGI